jgi:hypothetical protein
VRSDEWLNGSAIEFEIFPFLSMVDDESDVEFKHDAACFCITPHATKNVFIPRLTRIYTHSHKRSILIQTRSSAKVEM